jgi:hypothetical protein
MSRSNAVYALPYTTTADARDYSVLTVPTARRRFANRLAILWDLDRAIRVINVLMSLMYRSATVFENVRAVAEHQGALAFWYDSSAREPEKARELIVAATKAALAPFDTWAVEPLRLIRCHDGIVDRRALEFDDPLNSIPCRYSLGLVRS